MEITATQQAVEMLRRSDRPLYVWPATTSGCQPMAFLETATEQPEGRTFRQAPFAACDLFLSTAGPWPDNVVLTTRRGRVCALWNGTAWRI